METKSGKNLEVTSCPQCGSPAELATEGATKTTKCNYCGFKRVDTCGFGAAYAIGSDEPTPFPHELTAIQLYRCLMMQNVSYVKLWDVKTEQFHVVTLK